MTVRVPIHRELFESSEKVIAKNESFTVIGFKYPTGVESLRLCNDRGELEILPFFGQIIWDAQFDGSSLRMRNMFSMPQPAEEIVDTYGCFAFHSGLLSAGCPSASDTHPLHGEFACARMDCAWLELEPDQTKVVSEYEYVKGFGAHYRARPSVTLHRDSAYFDIEMEVSNLSEYQPMEIQYMCHMNYAFVPGAKMTSNIPYEAMRLRETIPAHVTPTPQWEALNNDLRAGKIDSSTLHNAESFDPEIVYFADELTKYTDHAIFNLRSEQGTSFTTEFDTADFPVATRWILYNPDQQVAAFVLPGTSRPEGFLAAKQAGTLVRVDPGATKTFTVKTGIKE